MLDSPWTALADPTIKKILLSVTALTVIFIIGYLAQISTSRYLEDGEGRYKAKKWIKNSSYIISILVLLAIFSNQLGGLAVFAGALSVGIAIALQEVIVSVAGWMAATMGNFYRPGDRVQLGGIKGDVIDISVLRTTIMEIGEWLEADLPTGRTVRIANSFVFKEPVFNYTSDFPFLWDEIKIPIRHGSDHVLAKDLLHELALDICDPIIEEAAHSWKDMKRSYFIDEVMMGPQVTVKITDNWLEFTVRYLVGYRDRRVTKDLLFTRILEEIKGYPERITIASATVALVETPTIHVKMDESRPK